MKTYRQITFIEAAQMMEKGFYEQIYISVHAGIGQLSSYDVRLNNDLHKREFFILEESE